MLNIDSTGYIVNGRVKRTPRPVIEHGALTKVNGIIVHQTGGSTGASSLSSYTLPNANGAHFLIDKDGTIYQCASLKKQTWHVGKLKARCVAEHRCSPKEFKYNPTAENKREMKKEVPQRYPSNEDSVGIEIVGVATKDVYEAVNAEQNASLKWLVAELSSTLGVPMTEVFRHPDVSRKNETEASTASW
ncbi:N-acetylmuramoyl-L-alanine amidase [Massilia sp. CCM 8734]|uniref:peptidoglycan recognition protein family protein n=1 Tax=Massilia sp. CCM 8734 TaxID=2609283 RepID=UPI0014247BB6|nr:N-acetylmuramoyl-L-alanine amidase [Massilia sp. CCM 8734]